MFQHEPARVVNPNEAPEGFYAVPKASLPQDKGNLCRQCDFRTQCQAMVNSRGNCAGYTAIAPDGGTLKRNDGVSVVFKSVAN